MGSKFEYEISLFGEVIAQPKGKQDALNQIRVIAETMGLTLKSEIKTTNYIDNYYVLLQYAFPQREFDYKEARDKLGVSNATMSNILKILKKRGFLGVRLDQTDTRRRFYNLMGLWNEEAEEYFSRF